jgi:hypothetical protein
LRLLGETGHCGESHEQQPGEAYGGGNKETAHRNLRSMAVQ